MIHLKNALNELHSHYEGMKLNHEGSFEEKAAMFQSVASMAILSELKKLNAQEHRQSGAASGASAGCNRTEISNSKSETPPEARP